MYRLVFLIGRYELWTLYKLWDLFYPLWFTTVFTYYYMNYCNVLICQTREIIMEANKLNFDASSCYVKMLVRWMKLHFFILKVWCTQFLMEVVYYKQRISQYFAVKRKEEHRFLGIPPPAFWSHELLRV